jgi:peptidylprolyl isomerase
VEKPVLRRSRPLAALCAAVLLSGLAACGSESDSGDEATGSSGSAAGLEEVSFTGEVGESLTAEWSGAIEQPEETRVETLVEGDGEEIADGATVSTYVYVGNGSTQEDVFSDYDNGAPESIPNDEQVGEVFLEMMDGATYGSRVVAVTTPTDLLGANAESNSLGLGTDDSVVVVMDLVEEQEAAPTPSSEEAEDASPDSQPSVVSEGGDPVGLDFAGIDEPALDAPVQRVVLEEGDGPAVKPSDTVTVDYLGATYDADAPFDGSYSRGEPLVSPLSGLIPGWSIGLDGVPVGSRVLLQIPPAYGYGTQGSPPNIPGNATLWFLIDVVAAE